MKIEIDLNDILGDENGVESIEESVKRQVIEKLSSQVKLGVGKKIDEEISRLINTTIRQNMEALTPKLIDDLMNAEYTPVDKWGDHLRDRTTTFRKELVKTIHDQMVYKKESYDRENAFTKAVDGVVSENVKLFKTGFDKLVNEAFTRECFEYARIKTQEKLGIK